MTIEFNCPYCTALIRVPDNAGGGKGRCPKCATRIKVPKTSTPRPVELPPAAVAAAPPFTPPVMDEPILVDEPPDDQPREIENFFDPDYDPRTANRPKPAPVSASVEVPVTPSFPMTERPVVSSFPAPSSSKFARKKKSGAGIWLLGLGLLIAGGVGWYFWQQMKGEQLGGELIAETADALALPPGLIEKSSLKESADNVTTILKNLEKTPVPLVSTLMQVQLRGSSKGIHVYLTAGTKSRFYRVAVRNDGPLMKFHAKYTTAMEVQRRFDIDKAAAEFAVEYLRVIDRRADQVSVTGFRNSLAIPTLVKGLGYQVVATHNRTIYPCVYEDREGALYFLLPPDVTTFELSGRKDAAGATYFPATYKVIVAGPMDVPEVVSEDPAADSKGKPAKDKKSDDESESESMSDEEPKPKKQMDSEPDSDEESPKKKPKKRKSE